MSLSFFGYSLKYPLALFAYIPLAMLIIYLIRKRYIQEKDIENRKFDRVFLTFSRLVIFLLIIIAVSEPYKFTEITVPGDPSVTVLRDNSTSFQVFDSAVVDDLVLELQKRIPTTVRYIGSDEKSAIGDGILASMQGDDNLLVITDGNNNYGRALGDMMVFASMVNTTINSIMIDPVKYDASVTVEGPSEAIIDTTTRFSVKVRQVAGNKPHTIIVKLDGKEILRKDATDDSIDEVEKVLPEGYHELVAEIVVEDYFPQNNVFYKTVHILPKPNVLYVSAVDTPFFNSIANVYNVHLSTDIPSDLSFYHAVVLDDMPAIQLDDNVEQLAKYISDGNGMVVIGGKSAYDLGSYKDSRFEGLLPARVGAGGEGGKGDVTIVILIDVSGSTGVQFSGTSQYKSADVQKALAVEILNSLKPKSKVAVIAFDVASYVVDPPTAIMSKDLDALKARIASLESHDGTNMAVGLNRALQTLEGKEGSKSIIVISDGLTQYPSTALSFGPRARALGTTIYTVGVGQLTSELFMKELARLGGGSYFRPDETEKLVIAFGEGEKENVEEAMGLVVLNSDHFITEGLSLKASVTGYNQVLPKGSARLLIATEKNNPIVMSWRYGLGRVVSVATDSGGYWAGQLMLEENAEVVSRVINWAVGDINRNDEFSVDAADTYLGKESVVYVVSDTEPQNANLSFAKIGPRRYAAQYVPESIGFISFFDVPAAVNFNEEYKSIGMNRDLLDIVTVTGGEMLDPKDVDKIVEKIKKDSQRRKIDFVYYSWIFALAAIVLFLIELIVRRIRENTNLYK